MCVCVCVDVFPISPGHPYPTLSQNPPLTHLKQITSQLFDLKTKEDKRKVIHCVKWTWCTVLYCTVTAGHTCQGVCHLQNWEDWFPYCFLYLHLFRIKKAKTSSLGFLGDKKISLTVCWSCHMLELCRRLKKGPFRVNIRGKLNRCDDVQTGSMTPVTGSSW